MSIVLPNFLLKQSPRHLLFRRAVSAISIPFGDCNRQIKFETNKLAKLADSAVTASVGDSSVLATVVSRNNARTSSSFLSLNVDYRLKASPVGRIPLNFIRRELGQTDTEIICETLCLDENADPVILSINAVSTALSLSTIAWNGPVGAVRMAIVNGQPIVNPNRSELAMSQLNLILSATWNDRIVMMDMDGREVTVAELEEAIEIGLKHIRTILERIDQFGKSNGRTKIELVSTEIKDPQLELAIRSAAESKLYYELTNSDHDKMSRDRAIAELKENVCAFISVDEGFVNIPLLRIEVAFDQFLKKLFREIILEENKRCDGRELNDIRTISSEVNLYKRLHGSSLFQRGQTQVLTTVSFDSKQAAFRADNISVMTGAPEQKMFMLHYEFPPFSTREIGSVRSANRRAIGHGALAEKALKSLLSEDFPFSVRVSCEVLESNGSSSMASVCGGSLALMDAGMAIKRPVAGIAIGLVCRDEKIQTDYRLLTDLLGIEDYLGDMDFKVAGTEKGLTALQLDVKLTTGIRSEIVSEALQKATNALYHVRSEMAKTLEQPNPALKSNGPVNQTISVPLYKRAQVIGPGGYNIRLIESSTGVQITQDGENHLAVFAPNPTAWQQCKDAIEKSLEENREPQLDFGAMYKVRIVELRDSGVLIVIKDGINPIFVPNDQLDTRKIEHASAIGMKVGDEITIKYFGRDMTTGRHRFSRKLLLTTEQGAKNYLKKTSTAANESDLSEKAARRLWGK